MSMIVWSTVEAGCPICSRRLRLRELGGGFVVGQDTDLLVRMSGKHLIQAEVHTCSGCKYSGLGRDFLRSVTQDERSRFLQSLSPSLHDTSNVASSQEGGEAPAAQSTPLPDVQYHWAARAAEVLGLGPTEQGERWLRAYWCLRLPPSSLMAPTLRAARRKHYLRWAISKLRQGLRNDADRNRVYLVAELCRRNGNFLLSETYFRRYLEREQGADYLRRAAQRLLVLAHQRLADELTLEDVLYHGERRPGSRTEGGAPRDAS